MRSMFSTVRFSVTLAPTAPQARPVGLSTSFCGSINTMPVSFALMPICPLRPGPWANAPADARPAAMTAEQNRKFRRESLWGADCLALLTNRYVIGWLSGCLSLRREAESRSSRRRQARITEWPRAWPSVPGLAENCPNRARGKCPDSGGDGISLQPSARSPKTRRCGMTISRCHKATSRTGENDRVIGRRAIWILNDGGRCSRGHRPSPAKR